MQKNLRSLLEKRVGRWYNGRARNTDGGDEVEVFTSTLNQTAFLFSFIIIGFVLAKIGTVPKNTATVLSKLENVLFVPALVFGTFAQNFTRERIGAFRDLLLASVILFIVLLPISLFVPRLLTKDKYLQHIDTYGLAFANFGFMGNAVVSALFPGIFLEYIIFTIPLWTAIYVWAVPALLIANESKREGFLARLKKLLNPMFIGMLLGALVGTLDIRLPSFAMSVVTASGNCMSPIAMLLTGMTVSAISLKKTFTNIHIYILTVIRLVAIPLLFVLAAHLLHIEGTLYICALCALSMPLGLNTVVIPSAYGKDTTVAAGMAVVSHLLSCLTIPLIFALFG